MRIEKIQPAFWVLQMLLTIVLMIVLQTLVDRFYPFNGSKYWVLGISFGAVSWSLSRLSMRFGWFGMTKSDAAKFVKTKIESPLKFIATSVIFTVMFSILIEFTFHQIPILQSHWSKNSLFILGFIPAMQIAKYIAHKKGWIVDLPIETKPLEKI